MYVRNKIADGTLAGFPAVTVTLCPHAVIYGGSGSVLA